MEGYIGNINDMIFMAFIHGGDKGGPYGCYIEGVKAAVHAFLVHASLENEYILATIELKYGNTIYSDVPQIVKIVN